MCGLICALNRDRSGSLPQGRKELYEAAMEMLLQRRDPERRVLYADAVKLQRAPASGCCANWPTGCSWTAGSSWPWTRPWRRSPASCPPSRPPRARAAAEDIFNHLLLRTGLLREQSDHAVEFVHRTVQDYLAAKEAVEQGAFDLLLAHAHESEWEEVIRMAVAHARPGECAKLLGGLLAPGRTGMQRNRRRLLAAACLEHVTELDPDTHARIRRETRHMVRPTTVEAARSLGWVGPIVLEMLPDPVRVTDREAHRLAVTVTRINDDAAIHYLAQLRNRARWSCAPNSRAAGATSTPTATPRKSSGISTRRACTSPSRTASSWPRCGSSEAAHGSRSSATSHPTSCWRASAMTSSPTCGWPTTWGSPWVGWPPSPI